VERLCTWIEITDDLKAEVCENGDTLMYHDTATGDVWLANETPPAKWQKHFRPRRHGMSGLGAAAVDGMCPPHPSIRPHPAQKIVRLQNALNALARRTGDHLVGAHADGLVGSKTVKAVNRAMFMYAKGGAPSDFTTGKLTHRQVGDFAPQLAAYIERSPIAAANRVAPTESPSLPEPAPQISPSTPSVPSSGGTMPPYSYPGSYPGYYAPTYYGPGYSRGPGGLPADRASVDVKAFVPAQYEHVNVDPMTVMAAIVVGVGIYFVATRKKAKD
jgi:hypothetical protein